MSTGKERNGVLRERNDEILVVIKEKKKIIEISGILK